MNLLSKAKDPLEPLDGLILRAIPGSDQATLDQIEPIFSALWQNFAEDFAGKNEGHGWNPYRGIIAQFLDYMLCLFKKYVKMADRLGLDSVQVDILETTGKIASDVVKQGFHNEVILFLRFWKELADSNIGRTPIVFKEIVSLYCNLADNAFEMNEGLKYDWLNEVFQNIGWLGERLLSKSGIEETPIMDDDYMSEWDALSNMLFSFRYKYEEKANVAYPLAYFAAVSVIFIKLVDMADTVDKETLKQCIFDCLYAYRSFAEYAIPNGNCRGAALALSKLGLSFDRLKKHKLEDSAKDAAGYLAEIGVWSAAYADRMKRIDFMPDGMENYVIQKIGTSQFGDHINHELYEANLKSGGDVDRKLSFIRSLQSILAAS
ncbi:MAG: hypothetical protein NTY09_01685 [bacterium]|nr:hypothetical protein [bacterium]